MQVVQTEWCFLTPRKVCIFMWRLRWKRIPVRSVLHDKGIDWHSLLCPMCGNDIETIDYCFITCPRVSRLWKDVFRRWGWSLLTLQSVEDLLSCTDPPSISESRRIIWKAIVWIACYMLWNQSNKWLFDSEGVQNIDLLFQVQLLLFQWISKRIKNLILSWPAWCGGQLFDA